jgi:hypothetical protein
LSGSRESNEALTARPSHLNGLVSLAKVREVNFSICGHTEKPLIEKRVYGELVDMLSG